MTDTHNHLYLEQFDSDRDLVINRALEAGVTRFFLPAIDASYYPRMMEMEKRYEGHVFLMAGLHPTHVKEDYKKELDAVADMLDRHLFYAIGEIGIDLYWDKSFLAAQKEAFELQIGWAKQRDLPIVIHCREAFDEIFEVMDRLNDDRMRGIFHCFTGNEEQAQKILGYGFKLGIGGVVTFKNGKIDQFLHKIPLNHIVLETDAPYLAPVPYRGKRNEPVYLTHVLDKLTGIYNLSSDEIAEVTTRNADEVFGM